MSRAPFTLEAIQSLPERSRIILESMPTDHFADISEVCRSASVSSPTGTDLSHRSVLKICHSLHKRGFCILKQTDRGSFLKATIPTIRIKPENTMSDDTLSTAERVHQYLKGRVGQVVSAVDIYKKLPGKNISKPGISAKLAVLYQRGQVEVHHKERNTVYWVVNPSIVHDNLKEIRPALKFGGTTKPKPENKPRPRPADTSSAQAPSLDSLETLVLQLVETVDDLGKGEYVMVHKDELQALRKAKDDLEKMRALLGEK